jgi:hypothetical protein
MTHLLELDIEVCITIASDYALKELRSGYARRAAGGDEFAYKYSLVKTYIVKLRSQHTEALRECIHIVVSS